MSAHIPTSGAARYYAGCPTLPRKCDHPGIVEDDIILLCSNRSNAFIQDSISIGTHDSSILGNVENAIWTTIIKVARGQIDSDQACYELYHSLPWREIDDIPMNDPVNTRFKIRELDVPYCSATFLTLASFRGINNSTVPYTFSDCRRRADG